MKLRWIVVLALMGLLILAWPVQAGGWVVISVTEWPDNVSTAAPQPLRFTLLQHGQTPFQGAEPVILLSTESQQPLRLPATATGVPGEYEAEILFPAPGNWTATIQARPFPQELTLPTITVPAPAADTVPATPGPAVWPALLRWGAAALLMLAGVSFVRERRQAEPSAVWTAGD